MFCMHCGQQLPDEAKFCFKCGNKTFTEKDVLPVAEAETVTIPETAPVVEPVTVTEGETMAKKEVNIKTLWENRKVRYIALGVAAVFVVAIIILVAAIPKVTVRIPDPEVYFSLPLADKSTDNGVKIYEYKVYNDEDMREAVDSYVSHLRNDYNFLLTNTNAEKNYIIYKFFSKDNNKAELSVYYSYGSFNEISVRMSRNIGFEADTTLSYKSASSGKDSSSSSKGNSSENKGSSSSNKNGSGESTITSTSRPTYTGVGGKTESKPKENSSVSSSNSHSTASVNKDLYDVKSRCGVCGGDGDCNTCGGDGKLYSSASKKEDRNCYKCSGRGNCRTCGGDGWVGEG